MFSIYSKRKTIGQANCARLVTKNICYKKYSIFEIKLEERKLIQTTGHSY